MPTSSAAWDGSSWPAATDPRLLAECQLTYSKLRTHFCDFSADEPEEPADGADPVIANEWRARELVRRQPPPATAVPLHPSPLHHRQARHPRLRPAPLRRCAGLRPHHPRHLSRTRLAARAWTWHEAADTRVFYPRRDQAPEGLFRAGADYLVARDGREMQCGFTCHLQLLKDDDHETEIEHRFLRV